MTRSRTLAASHPRWLLSVVALVATLVGSTQAAPPPPFNSDEARKSVVFIKRITPGLGIAVGSGFIVSEDGLIYTNRHVALPSDEGIKGTILLVGVPSDKDPDVLEYYRAETVYAPEKKENLDFAVLKIEVRKGGPKLRPLPLSYDKLNLGSEVAVLGYPHVQENQPNLSFNKGSISSTRVRIEERSYYQTDAAINPGNSGGPLLNTKGEAVGIVTFKKGRASNIGFAVYLAEVKPAAEQAKKQAVRVKPVPGPLDPRNLPVVAGIAPKKANWDVTAGTLREDKGAIVLDNNGNTYWVTSKEPLPQDFQLVIQCRIEFLKGDQQLQVSQKSILRTLCVRFDSPDTKSMILEPKGTLVKFSHELLLLYKEGANDAVKVERKGNSDEPFVLVITRVGGDYTVAVDGEILLKYHDDKPLKGGQKFCIGGFLSRLHLGEVSVIKLEAPPAKVEGKSPLPKENARPGDDPKVDKESVAKASEVLVGKWSARVGSEFRTEWTFAVDGTVTSTKGEPKGTWRIESKDGTANVLIEWPIAKAWERLPLPLNPKGATGTSSAGPKFKIEAVKLKDESKTPGKTGPPPVAPLRADNAEDKAVEVVKKWHGSVRRDEKSPGKPVVAVYLFPSKITDTDVKAVAAFKELVSLNLHSTAVTDAGVKEFVTLEKLTELHLGHTGVSDAGLKDLTALKNLTVLDLRGTKVTDAGMKELAKLKKLTTLYLSSTAVTDEGLKELAKLDMLSMLLLNSTKITGKGLKELAALKNLTTLYLMNTPVADAGAKELAALTQLKMVYLDSTSVTDAGVKELAALKNLTTLTLRGTALTDVGIKELGVLDKLTELGMGRTKVTAAGANELRKMLPKCKVSP